jgi:surface polysaccharide O-acyltransferase-like enzyme
LLGLRFHNLAVALLYTASTLKLMVENRNYTIDALRTVGAFSVIVLHTQYDGFLTNKAVNAISLCARWAVPFFFLVSGYFFEKKSRLNLDIEFTKSLKYLLGIFLVSNAIYSLVALQTVYYSAKDVLSIRSIVLGNWFHLWFIGSMIVGYTSLWFIVSIGMEKAMSLIAFFVLLLALIIGPYASFNTLNIDLYFTKFIISIPLLFTGFLYSKYNLSRNFKLTSSILIIILGFISMFVENYIIYNQTKPALINHEYVFGTFVLALGLFMLSFNIGMNKDNVVSRIGRKYSLMIYLYHPLLIVIISFAMKKFARMNQVSILWLNPLAILILTLSIIVIISKMYPRVYNVISGKL